MFSISFNFFLTFSDDKLETIVVKAEVRHIELIFQNFIFKHELIDFCLHLLIVSDEKFIVLFGLQELFLCISSNDLNLTNPFLLGFCVFGFIFIEFLNSLLEDVVFLLQNFMIYLKVIQS